MASRISLALVICFALSSAVGYVQQAVAVDTFYKGPNGPNWNVVGNWQAIYQGGTISTAVPRGSGGFNMRAVIGTDNTTYGLDKSVELNVLLPVNNQTIHGLALGSRERTPDPTLAYVNPEPAAGTMVGALTISGATTVLKNTTGPHAAIGADGSIKVGVEGRGYLTMLGGLLEGTSLSVAGEDNSTGNGTSLLDLRGSSTLTVTGSGSSTLSRRLRVEGPSVNFTSGGNLQLQSTNSYTAVITSSTLHSPLKTNANALLGGSLFVEFSGAGATHTIGERWDLVDASGSIPGSVSTMFNNLQPGGVVIPTGLASPAPLGTAYRLEKVEREVSPGDLHTVLELAYEGLVVLRVNRDTGELSLTNPHNRPINIEGYEIRSPLGSLLPTYKGISGAPAGDSGWEKVPLNSETGLAELKSMPFTSLPLLGVPSLTLGTGAGKGFEKTAVAGDVANFGNDGEDLEFFYTTPDGPIRGHVEYIGTKFENNLVLRVNPATGEAFLKNDSHETLTFDGYSITSSTGSLDSTGWDGLGGTWLPTDLEPDALSETNLFGSITLEPEDEVAIGDIGAFTTSAEQAGLSMEFILSVGLGEDAGPLVGDHNGDGTVDAADYVYWRKNNTDGPQGYTDWVANFGATGGGAPPPEMTFRPGSVVFDTGAGGGGVAAVPEPNAAWLMIVGLVGAMALGSRARRTPRQFASIAALANIRTNGQVEAGGRNMSSRFGSYLAALVAAVALIDAQPAVAAPQGALLVNYDFEDPGPPGAKAYAYDLAGAPIAGAVPGWVFTGPGMEDFGHPERLGDSGTEGSGGNPLENEMLLSVNDGRAYQIASGFTIQSIPSTQIYKLAFDARDIFTIDAGGQGLADSGQLTARFFYGAWAEGQRTLLSQAVDLTGDDTRYEFTIAHDSPLLLPGFGALGQTIGIEFTTTSKNRNALVDKSWSHIDNVVMEIAPVLPGDLDGNGVLTTADYDLLRANIAASACYTSPSGIRGCPFEADGELTGDYAVDLNDFRAFKTLFAGAGSGGTSGGSSPTLIDGANIPEPSTGLLVLIAVAAFAGVRRRCAVRNWLRPLALAAVSGAATFVTVSQADAELYAYDPFRVPNPLTNPANPAAGEYNEWSPPTPGQVEPIPHVPLAGQNPTPPFGTQPGFFNGQWRTAGNAPGGIVHPTGIRYLNTSHENGSARVAPVPNPSYNPGIPATGICGGAGNPLYSSCDGRTARFLATPYTDSTNETVYVSFVANFGTTTGDMGFRAVEFFPSTSVPTADWSEDRFLDLGYNGFYGYGNPVQQNPATARLGLGLYSQGQQQILIDAPSSYNADGRNHLFILKFEFSNQNNMDNVLVYMDPASTSEPELPNAEFRNRNFSLGAISTVTRYGGTAPDLTTIGGLGSAGIFDELRFGSTFADVLPPGLPCPGDTDGNCVINLVDYETIRDNFLRTDVAGPTEGDVARSDGRLGFDGRVDSGDFWFWKRMYEEALSGSGGGAGANIPEPASGALAFIVATFVFGMSSRRRRMACPAG
jgi:hypothetical protein